MATRSILPSSAKGAPGIIGALLWVLGAGIALLTQSALGLGTWTTLGIGVFCIALAALTDLASTAVLAGIAIVGTISGVSLDPSPEPARLMLMAPAGLTLTLGLLLITSLHQFDSTLNLREFAILLGSAILGLIVIIIAVVTPLPTLTGRLVASAFLVVLLVGLSQLAIGARRRRDPLVRQGGAFSRWRSVR